MHTLLRTVEATYAGQWYQRQPIDLRGLVLPPSSGQRPAKDLSVLLSELLMSSVALCRHSGKFP